MLNHPPRDLHKQALPVVTVRADAFFRVSRHGHGEPFFGRARANRFDANHRDAAKRFGTLYCGFDLETALAESVLHDEMPVRRLFQLSVSDFKSRFLVRFRHGQDLVLADLAGAPLKRLGGNGAISTITPYTLPRQWARAVHDHPDAVDGIRYVSRHLNTEFAAVIFDRAAARIGAPSYVPLLQAAGIVAAVSTLGIAFGRK